jgi:hypothetical protein
VDRDVGPQVVQPVARAQVADAVHAAGHEPGQRDDRERHVQVEDLLHEALVGVVGRVEEHEREGADDEHDGRDREGLQPPGESCGVSHSSRRKSKIA